MSTRFELEQHVFCCVKRFILVDGQDVIRIGDIYDKYGFQNMPDGKRKQMISEKMIAKCLKTLSDPANGSLRRYPISTNPKRGYRYEYDDEAALRYFVSQDSTLSRALTFDRIKDMVGEGWFKHPAEGIYRWNIEKVFETPELIPGVEELFAQLNEQGADFSLEGFKQYMAQMLVTGDMLSLIGESRIFLLSDED